MAYSYYRAITIDYTKVDGSNQTDFPVLVSGTYTYLKTVGNGGLVQNANGYDVAFYSDSGLTTQLKHETERYVATTGEVVYWVKVPTVSYTANTVIYMAYGDSGISTDQSDAVNVWDSNFKAVIHAPDGTTLTTEDSTSNNYDGTVTSANAATGKVGGGAVFTNGTTSRVTLNSAAVNLNEGTISMWIKPSFNATDGTFNYFFDTTSARHAFFKSSMSGLVQMYNDARTTNYTGLTFTAGTWYHFVFVYKKTGNVQNLYINGVLQTAGTTAGTWGSTALGANAFFGNNHSNNTSSTSTLDEMRISNTSRSANWIKTEYNNQNSPSTFYSVGSEVAVGGAVPGHRFFLNM